MDRCTKVKVFNLVLLFCLVNFFIYRYFGIPSIHGQPKFKQLRDTVLDTLKLSPADHSSNGNHNNNNNNNNIGSNGSGVATSRSFTPPAGSAGTGPLSQDAHLPVAPLSANTNISQAKVANRIVDAGHKQNPANATAGIVTSTFPMCPLVPPHLNGPLRTFTQPLAFDKIAKDNPLLRPGGRFKPMDCKSRHRVAIIIPYRNREEHLKILLNNLHPILIRQQLDYGIFVIDQAPPTRFNRAMLMNIGWKEAIGRYDYQCGVFHDVDLIPENDRNIYSCPKQPRHMSAAIDKFLYRLPYADIYGGVSAVSKEHLEMTNGFSNMFFGWGGEDDDMAARIQLSGLKITRYPLDIARYRMIKHTHEKGNEQNPGRYSLLKTTKKRMASDGLNSLKYKVKEVDEQPTHTRIVVEIDQKEMMKS